MDKKEFEWKRWEEVKDTFKMNELLVGYIEDSLSTGYYAIGVVSIQTEERSLYDLAWGNFFIPEWVMSFEEFRKK